MSTESKTGRLTVDDPVSNETLAQFSEIEDAFTRVAVRLLHLEQEKIQLLAAAKRATDERQTLFESVLIARGVSPSAGVTLDSVTGKLTLRKATPPAPEEPTPKE